MAGRLPSLRGLEAFLHLVEAGGLRAAARAMNLSVSAVSHRLRTFEDEVGATLFERGARSLRLTPAARQFHDELIPISRDLIAATARLANHKVKRALRVSISSVLASNWLAGRLGEWQKNHPGVRLEIRTVDSNTREASDISILTRYDDQPEEGEDLLFGWELTPICRPGLVEEYGIETPADLAHVPLLDVGKPRGGWSAWLAGLGLPPDYGDRSMVLDSHDVLLDAATRGLGVAMGALGLSREYEARGLIMPFASIRARIPGGAYASGPGPGESHLVSEFRRWLIEQSRS